MDEKIVSIYENIYNKELDWKNSLDDKFASRLTLLIAIITATFIIFTTIFFPDKDDSEILRGNLQFLCKLFSIICMGLLLCLLYSFHKCFFRIKLNYKVMPTTSIRIFHFYIHKNNLCGTKDEEDLYNYLNDSYQFCAFTNADINSKRERALIVFDNVVSLSFVFLMILYILMVRSGYSIDWIF